MSEEKTTAPPEEKPVKEERKKTAAPKKSGKIVAIRIRGGISLRQEVRLTLDMLGLFRQNYCSVYQDTPSIRGMLQKVKDYVTWGEVDNSIVEELVKKKGEDYKGRLKDSSGKISYNKYLEISGRKVKKYFRLNPPRGGFGKQGIKKTFRQGGTLGYRKDKIVELLKKMM